MQMNVLVPVVRHLVRRLVAPAVLAGSLVGTLVLAEPAAVAAVSVYVAPPPRRREIVPARPSPHHVWASGEWVWQPGAGYVWQPGYWTVAPPGRVWVAVHWDAHGRRWDYVPGRWRRAR
jgi:hypothetical protein